MKAPDLKDLPACILLLVPQFPLHLPIDPPLSTYNIQPVDLLPFRWWHPGIVSSGEFAKSGNFYYILIAS